MLNPAVSQKMRADTDRRGVDYKPKSATTILHVDMDAFFAAIEEKDNPSLEGKPVIIGGPKDSRGVVTTCNYIARSFGVHSGMSLVKAGQLCPDAIYLKTFGRKYTWTSLKLMTILRKFSPKVEPYSIDEAFLDATGCTHLWGGNEPYGLAVKKAIKETLDLTASVGIGPSRIVAKMASNLDKPDGLTVIPKEKVDSVLGPLPVEAIPGVGDSTKKSLNSIGIQTVSQLAAYPISLLRAHLGINGEALVKIARGEGGDKVIALEERPHDKSMGHEKTFGTDVADKDEILGCLLNLSDKVARRLRRENYYGNVVTLKLRHSDFSTYSHQHALGFFTNDPQEIFDVGHGLLEDIWNEGDCKIRLIGICVSHLARPNGYTGIQENLFQAATGYKRRNLFKALDNLRDEYGEDVLQFAGGLSRAGFRSSSRHPS